MDVASLDAGRPLATLFEEVHEDAVEGYAYRSRLARTFGALGESWSDTEPPDTRQLAAQIPLGQHRKQPVHYFYDLSLHLWPVHAEHDGILQR